MVARRQLLEAGYGPDAIKHRVRAGRLHPVGRGVYAVGRRELTQYGRWMAVVLACGPLAALSHRSAAALWRISTEPPGLVVISLPAQRRSQLPGVRIHRRASLGEPDLTTRHGISVTSPTRTLLDLTTELPRDALEGAVNAADKRDLIDPETLREALEGHAGQPGVRRLRALLDRRTFVLTDTALERWFLPVARDAGLSKPQTQRWINGFRVDFFWPELGLVVEADGLRYHRTAAQQTEDRRRDHAHAAAGFSQLRFSHAQVRYEPEHVKETLRRVARRLEAS